MAGIAAQPALLLVHLCASPVDRATVEAIARDLPADYRHYTDAFATAAALLGEHRPDRPGRRTLLLVSPPGLAKVELGLIDWARRRWQGLTVWTHGPGRRPEAGGWAELRHVELSQLAADLRELAAQSGPVGASSPTARPPVQPSAQPPAKPSAAAARNDSGDSTARPNVVGEPAGSPPPTPVSASSRPIEPQPTPVSVSPPRVDAAPRPPRPTEAKSPPPPAAAEPAVASPRPIEPDELTRAAERIRAAEAALAELPDEPEQIAPAPPTGEPPIKLHRDAPPSQPLLSVEELDALLGPEDVDGV